MITNEEKDLNAPVQKEEISKNPEVVDVESTTKNKKLKCINMMYVNQLSYMKENGLPTDLQELKEFIQTRIAPKEFALILHDKDKDDKGEPIPPHIHIALRFNRQRYLNVIAEKLLDKNVQNIIKWRGQYKNMYSYLVHLTSVASKKKFRYPDSDVIASFDFEKTINGIIKNFEQPRKDVIEQLLNDYGYRKISYEGLIEELEPVEFAKYKKDMDIIKKGLLNDLEVEDYKNEMIAQNKPIQTYFCFGTTGTGKTSWAVDFATKSDTSYCITGSNRDPFQNYNNEKIIIMDEVRPDDMNYAELLKILDPYNFEVAAGSRYYDKVLTAEVIIITTPYSPKDFYTAIRSTDGLTVLTKKDDLPVDVHTIEVDSPQQLYRRIQPLEFTRDFITPLVWNDETQEFKHLDEHKQKNNWSRESTFATKEDVAESMKTLFGNHDEVPEND